MNALRRLLFVGALFFVAAVNRSAIGQSNTILRTAGYTMTGTLADQPAPGMTTKGIGRVDAAQSFLPSAPVLVAGSVEESVNAKGRASASLSAYSEVKFGRIKIGVVGAASASTSAEAADLAQGGSVSNLGIGAFGDFRDLWHLTSASHPNRDLVVNAEVLLSGGWGVSVNGTPKFIGESPLNAGGVGLQLFLTTNGIVDPITPDVPNRIGIRNAVLGDTEPFSLPDLAEFDKYSVQITKTIREGMLSDYVVGLRLAVNGFVRTDAGGDSVSAFFHGDFQHTLNWGGITSVTDAVTGEPVNDWLLQAQSGFDYSHAIPEPPTITLVLVLFVLLPAASRRSARPS